MAFKFYIDGQLTDQPGGDTALVTTIKRDTSIGGMVVTQEASVTYNANNNLAAGEISGYAYLKSLFESGICNEAVLVVYDEVSQTETNLVYTGVIKIPEVSIDLQEMLLTCKVNDNSFYSYIYNNKDIVVNLDGVKTKSQQNIVPPSKYKVDLFNSIDCAYGSDIGAFYEGIRVVDALDHIIKSITDNKVSFQSDYLSTLDNEIFLFKGTEILKPYTLFPASAITEYKTSLSELLTELDKLKNLLFYVDNTDPDNPVFQIESYEATFGFAVTHTFDKVKKLQVSVDTDNLFGTVTAGSEITGDGQLPFYTWDSGISHFGWINEQYFPLGQCNTNQELDLKNTFIIDNNVIQDVLIGQNAGYLDDYFFIECNTVDTVNLTAIATQWDHINDGGCYYNAGLNNISKMQRHSVKFETNFGNFLSTGNEGFRALIGNTPANDLTYVTAPASAPNVIPVAGLIVSPGNYANETLLGGYDGDNNYNNTLFRYVIPADGQYSFRQRIEFEKSGMVSFEVFDIYNTLTLYDAANNVKQTVTQMITQGGNGLGVHDLTSPFIGLTTDYVEASYRIVYHPNQAPNQQNARSLVVLYTSFFECNGTPDGDAVIASGNTDIKKYLYEFAQDCNETDFRAIVANPTGLIEFIKDEVSHFGWIVEVNHNHWTGETKVKLKTNNAITSQ